MSATLAHETGFRRIARPGKAERPIRVGAEALMDFIAATDDAARQMLLAARVHEAAAADLRRRASKISRDRKELVMSVAEYEREGK